MATPDDPDLEALARRFGFGPDAVAAALAALRRGGATRAQFDHPDLGGLGQWLSNGMLMIGDMFNDRLKARVSTLFDELAPLAAAAAPARRAEATGAPAWPADLGAPSASGAQNGVRYAVFPATRRLAIERDGATTVYDTGDARITGVGQRQGAGDALGFTGPDGPVALDALRQVAPAPARETRPRPEPEPRADASDLVGQIERLHGLLHAGALSEDEFAAAKRKLLA